ncbi:TauD/TfdA dioxygenase family protein [Streptomyces sp. 1222.5]|uniref:TauD/TfdA dioxygenase family protein n=1 Tax=Streptomyces sp. 1222.5 TaxID=1881026 RepID=UPI003EB9852C
MNSLQIAPITKNIGAEISGVDLSRPLTPEVRHAIEQALMVHQAIFFRDQHLNPEQLKRFGSDFGKLEEAQRYALPGHPEILRMHTDADSDYVVGEGWHSDTSCLEEPPMGSVLYLHTVPAVGGDTAFASMYAAYDALSERMQTYLAGLSAVHDSRGLWQQTSAYEVFPSATHPVVRTHPVTGRKALYVNAAYTTHIVGIGREESDAILSYLSRHCSNPLFQMRFRWKPHSVAFWDNRSVQHCALWDYYPETRSGYRVQLEGDRPSA